MKSSQLLSPLSTDCIAKMYAKEGTLEGTAAHLMLEKTKGFSYHMLSGELMYPYKCFLPDIEY